MPSPTIVFHSLVPVRALSARQLLKQFIARLFHGEHISLHDLSIVFCSDDYLLEINRQWLKHDYFTDTVTFTLSDPGKPISGEIYISLDRVRENARSFNKPLSEELHRVIFHSCLHLCGYRDDNPEAKKRMQLAENKWLSKYSRA